MRYPASARKYSGPPRIDEKELKRGFGSSERIFVCSTTDLFAADVPDSCINAVLSRMRKEPERTYMLQSKNPERMLDFCFDTPDHWWWGTTIETNRPVICSRAPPTCKRALALCELPVENRYVTIEPIMAFDIDELEQLVRLSLANKVFIGADSKRHHLPEPRGKDIVELGSRLVRLRIEVEYKSNSERLLQEVG